MVPFGLTPEQFTRHYRRRLENCSLFLIQRLTELFAQTITENVERAEVQIFLEQDGIAAPSFWIYYQGKNNRVDSSDLSIFPGRSLEIADYLPDFKLFDEQYSTDDEFGGLDIMANLLKTWFAECWWKAGGWNYSIPVMLHVHDGYGDGEAIALSKHTG